MIVRQQFELRPVAMRSCLFLHRAESADRTSADAGRSDAVYFW